MSFAVAAVGIGILHYQWEKDGVALVNGTTSAGSVISEATGPQLVITGLATADVGGYRCRVSDVCNTSGVYTSTALLSCSSSDVFDGTQLHGPYINTAPSGHQFIYQCLDFGGMAVATAAQAMGGYAFNYRSRIISLPAPWLVTTANGTVLKWPGFPLSSPLSDPIGNQQQLCVQADGARHCTSYVYPYDQTIDGLYFTQAEVNLQLPGNIFCFHDKPAAPAGFYSSLEQIFFETQLVLVDINGHAIRNVGASFHWSSNQTHSGGGLFDSTDPDDPRVPAYLDGGLLIEDPSSDVLSWYRFDDGAVGTPASNIADSGSAAQNGIASGGPLFSSDVHEQVSCTGASGTGTSLALDGTQHVDFSSTFPLNVPGDATVAFWIKSPLNAHQAVIWSNLTGVDGNMFQLYVNADSTFDFNYREPGGALHFNCCPCCGIPLSRNVWTHIMIARQGDNYQVYKNGVLVRTTVDVNPNLPNSVGWAISGRPGYRYVGLIDDLRFYNSAIIPEQMFSDPTISSQSPSSMSCTGAWVNFAINVAGTSPFTYNWQARTASGSWADLSDGDDIPIGNGYAAHVQGSGGASLSVGPMRPIGPHPNVVQFRCVVSNACGAATSSPATLTINSSDFDGDGDTGTDFDIQAFFACLGGHCCPTCGSADFDGDGDTGTDFDIQAFFRVLGGGNC